MRQQRLASHLLSPWRSWWPAAALTVSLLSGPRLPAADDHQPATAELETQIEQLIDQLGAEEFARRERAQAELTRLGLNAFDALHRAQDHEDIEIARRASYLIRSMRIRWVQDDDPVEVKQLLRDYEAHGEKERINRMQRLAALELAQGVRALCQLARFENSDPLSKRAALLVMQQAAVHESDQAELARRIQRTVGLSRRPAADWLRCCARGLENSAAAVAQWDQLIQRELETLSTEPAKTSHDVVRDLLRWQADLLLRLDRADEARAAMQRAVQLQDGTRDGLLDTVDWLIQRAAWAIVQEVAQRFADRFQTDPLLLYRLAEVQLAEGQKELAEQTAERALELFAEDPAQHVLAALGLQERGLIAWAEREYRRVLKLAEEGSPHNLNARFMLAEMLHDQQQELVAAEVLQAAVDLIQKDPNVMQLVAQRLQREPGSIVSRMHYFFALHAADRGDRKKQQDHLRRGSEADPTDADVLIAMHRLPDADAAWQARTRALIEQSTEAFRAEISQYEQQVAQSRNDALRLWTERELASACNQFAWLVSNTFGDYQEALRCSQQSLRVRPDAAGYLDTLGRCYFALQDYDNAVKYQSRAAALEPHSGQIVRQLQYFQEEQAKARPEPAER